jgi:signal transduction histidine kinase
VPGSASPRPLRVALLGSGGAAKRLAEALRRSRGVIVERVRLENGACRKADLVLDLRRRSRGKRPGLHKGTAERVGFLAAEIEAALRQQIEERQSDFVSLTSHELRTPLASSREAVSIVADGLLGGVTPEQRSYLDIAARNLRRLTGVINQLLDLADIEGDRVALAREPADLNEIAEKASARLRPQFEERGVRFGLEKSSEPLVANVDPERIQHVLEALLDNACKFTAAGGQVTLRLFGDRKRAVIEVEDTGIGIPTRTRHLLFQKFRQTSGALTRRHGGIGLGLALVREIVRSHGGSVEVESKEGRGSRFRVRIPRSRGAK